ncbi:MAG: hypothetical protein ACLTGT_02915 [Oscillospiraceae bacterium]
MIRSTWAWPADQGDGHDSIAADGGSHQLGKKLAEIAATCFPPVPV